MGKKVACERDSSDHGGIVTSHNQDGRFKVSGVVVAVEGAMHKCSDPDHGTTPISAVTTKSYCNGKLILTKDAFAGCGAKLTPLDRNVNVE